MASLLAYVSRIPVSFSFVLIMREPDNAQIPDKHLEDSKSDGMEDSMINSETTSLYEEIRDDDVKTGR
jgi:hypothetical protein